MNFWRRQNYIIKGAIISLSIGILYRLIMLSGLIPIEIEATYIANTIKFIIAGPIVIFADHLLLAFMFISESEAYWIIPVFYIYQVLWLLILGGILGFIYGVIKGLIKKV